MARPPAWGQHVTATERLVRYVVWFIAAFTVVFLMTPLIVTIAVSFGSSTVFTLPPPDWSLRWYQKLANTRGLLPALMVSLQVAAISTAIAMILGTLCAIALVRGRFPGREAISTFLISPLMLPGLVIGIAMLQGFKALGLRDVYASLLVAHVVITLPYVVRTVVGALSLFDFSLIDAARTLGCSYPMALTRVLVPALAPAFLTSGMFAFLASMDNYPISIFFTDAWTKTLPIQMLQYVEETPDPTIAAISAGLVLLAVLVLIIGDRLVGLRKLADF
jgi:putative spermidine/putrescine transport system permease protein